MYPLACLILLRLFLFFRFDPVLVTRLIVRTRRYPQISKMAANRILDDMILEELMLCLSGGMEKLIFEVSLARACGGLGAMPIAMSICRSI